MKFNTPLSLYQKIEEAVKPNMDMLVATRPESTLYKFTVNTHHEAYFMIFEDATKHYKISDAVDKFSISFRPASSTVGASTKALVNSEQLIGHLNSWLSIVRSFYTSTSVLDDPTLSYYQNIFSSQFQAQSGTDQESSIFPFKPDEQQKLQTTLTQLIAAIKDPEQFPESVDSKEIIAAIETVQDDLSSIPRTEAISRISRIAAWITKYGKRFGGSLINTVIEAGMKALVEKGFGV